MSIHCYYNSVVNTCTFKLIVFVSLVIIYQKYVFIKPELSVYLFILNSHFSIEIDSKDVYLIPIEDLKFH